MLWSSWAVRLTPPDGVIARVLAPVLATGVLIVGNRLDLDTAATRLGHTVSGTDVSRVLGHLGGQPCWADIVTALVRLADHLDAAEIPIDYRRRRDLDYARLLDEDAWRALCRRIGMPGGGDRRQRIAHCYLFARISGLPAEAAPGYPGDHDAEFRAEYVRVTALHTPELAQALDLEGLDFLAEHGIHGEPVTWQPPTSLLDGLDLPGSNPDDIDIPLLHRLVRSRRHPTWYAANSLGTSVEAVRHLLAQQPAPQASPSESQARATGAVFRQARRTLPKKTLVRLYQEENRSIHEISARTGLSRYILRRLLTEYGIPPMDRPKNRHQPVDRAWLVENYVRRQRTLADLAREIGMSPTRMAYWARRHEIPVRRPDRASRAAAFRASEAVILAPEILKPALTDAFATQRLARFATAAKYSNLGDAAQALGAPQSTLSHQIQALEHDLGHLLLQRAARGRPMKLTAFGKDVVAAVEQQLESSREHG